MAYFPAHCDNNCKGCEQNKGDWCIWKDRATSASVTNTIGLLKETLDNSNKISVSSHKEDEYVFWW